MSRWGRKAYEDREAWTAFVEGRAASNPPESKYNNVRTEFNGRSYASVREARHAELLQVLERHNKITDLQYQVGFTLVEGNGRLRPIQYIADFVYKTPDGRTHVVDVKGYDKNRVWRLKRKMMALMLGIEIETI
jgi:hypothetical protein